MKTHGNGSDGNGRDVRRVGLLLGWLLVSSAVAALAADPAWSRLGLAGEALETIVVHPAALDVLFAGGGPENGHGVWRSTDGGVTWEPMNAGLGDVHRVNAIAVSPAPNPTILLGVLKLHGPNLFRSTDGGATWQPATTGLPSTEQEVTAIVFDPSSPGIVYASMNGGGVWKSTDDGASWHDASGDLSDDFCGRGGCVLDLLADPSSPGTLYAALPVLGDVYKTTDGGVSWSPTGAGLWAEELVLAPRHPATVFATGTVPEVGGLVKSTNAGRTWTRLDARPGLPALEISSFRSLAIDPDDADTVWMVVEDVFAARPLEAVYLSCDGGASWSLADEGLEGVRVRGLTYYEGTVLAATNDGVYRRVDAPGGPTCVPGGICLGGSRFRVTARWEDGNGHAGDAHPVRMTDDTGAFWFFSLTNIEMIVKVLDGCAISGHYWVFAAGLTNVRVRWTVTDTVSGLTKSYESRLGEPFQPVLDTAAFASCD